MSLFAQDENTLVEYFSQIKFKYDQVTGIGHEDAHAGTGRDGAPVEIRHLLGLTQRAVVVEVHPPRVRDHGDHHSFYRWYFNSHPDPRSGISFL